VRAGSFYEAPPEKCRRHAEDLVAEANLPEDLPSRLFGGLVPHAGWVFSGRVAARTFKALAATGDVGTVVLFGADHTGAVSRGEVYEAGAWNTPLGEVKVDEKLAGALLGAAECLRANPGAHAYEHSIEVQLPLVQVLWPDAKFVPVAVPPAELATEIGKAVGRTIRGGFPRARVVGSTDLTHHGGHFGSPGGRGKAGVEWAAENDRRMLDVIEAMAAEKVLPEARKHQNACGAGAIAATIAACKEMGATRALVLEYTNSYNVMRETYPGTLDDTTVGYASVVFA
jgi:AmmeMemoRadiSam system protein B